MSARSLSHLAAAEADDLAEAIAVSNAKSLEQRTAEAIEWLCVSVVEIANTSVDEAELRRRLDGEMHVSLAEIWQRRTRR